MTVRFLNAGDGALTIEFGTAITPALVAEVAALEQAVQAAQARGGLPGVIETVPTFRSLTVLYDPLLTSRAVLDAALRALLGQRQAAQPAPARRWRLPVCYGGAFGEDLPEVAAACGLSPDAVAALHADTVFTVYMLGFMPGFPFMGGLPAALSMPGAARPGCACRRARWPSPGRSPPSTPGRARAAGTCWAAARCRCSTPQRPCRCCWPRATRCASRR